MSGKVTFVCGYGDVGKGSAESLRGQGARVIVSEIDPILALQAAMDGYQVAKLESVIDKVDVLITATGNLGVVTVDHMLALKHQAIVANVGHFDNEIDTAYMRKNWEWDEVKPQVHKVWRNKAEGDFLLLLSEGRLVNLGNATGHPSRIMDGSFANQVLAQMYLFDQGYAKHSDTVKEKMLKVEVLPKHLDEEVARYMVQGFGGVITKLTKEQADYIGVDVNGPYKPEHYKY